MQLGLTCSMLKWKRYFFVDENRDEEYFVAWEVHAGKQYAALMNRWKALYKTFGAGRKPRELTVEQWAQWRTWWDSAECQALSEQNSKNRLSEVDRLGTGISRHRGGLSQLLLRWRRCKKEAGGEIPSSYKVFSAMQIKDGVPLYGRSLRIKNAMEQRVAELEEAGEDYDESEIFDKINPLSKKQRRAGIGSAVAIYSSKGSSSSGSNQTADTGILESLEVQGEMLGTSADQLAEKDEIIRKLLETQEAEKEARLAALEAEREARLAMQRDFDQKLGNLTSRFAS